MKVEKKKLPIELRTGIDDRGEKELSIVKQIGQYAQRGNIEVLTFMEGSNEFGNVNNRITIRPGKVNIKRSGSIVMNQQFMEGKQTECLYRHPYGSFFLEIDTKSIVHRPLSNNREGKGVIVYEVRLDKEETRRHHLTLTYGGKDK